MASCTPSRSKRTSILFKPTASGKEVVNVYEFDETLFHQFRYKRFEEYTEEWAHFVYDHRTEPNGLTLHDYDIVFGPIANDRVGAQIARFKQGSIFFIDLNNTFRLPHRWQIEANMNIMTKGDVINYHMESASYRLGFVIQKCWLKNDALCLRASINDVLQRSVQDIRMSCGGYQLFESQLRSNHRLNISLRYTFNASKSKYKGTGAGQAERQRM